MYTHIYVRTMYMRPHESNIHGHTYIHYRIYGLIGLNAPTIKSMATTYITLVSQRAMQKRHPIPSAILPISLVTRYYYCIVGMYVLWGNLNDLRLRGNRNRRT